MSLCVKVEIAGNSVIKAPQHNVRFEKAECHLREDKGELIGKYYNSYSDGIEMSDDSLVGSSVSQGRQR